VDDVDLGEQQGRAGKEDRGESRKQIEQVWVRRGDGWSKSDADVMALY